MDLYRANYVVPENAHHGKLVISGDNAYQFADALLENNGGFYQRYDMFMVFDADNFVFGSFKLPEGEEMNPDEIFADRIRDLGTFRAVLTEYFKLYASTMLNDSQATCQAMREWVQKREAI